ncbi:hypothetical protein D0525_16435 [Salmonella enterica]|nr:hypothetical protein D0525_16435 [Salmonella enterica]
MAAGEVVNHIDGNKLNNHFSNLEIVSCQENNIHAFKLGLNISPKGAKSRGYKGDVIARCIETGAEIILQGRDEVKKAGFDYATVRACVNGKRRRHKGHTFEVIPR